MAAVRRIAYILNKWPYGLTSVVNELRALEKEGLDVRIVAVGPCGDAHEIRVSYECPFPVTYLSERSDGKYGWRSFLKDHVYSGFHNPGSYVANAALSLKWAGANFKQAARFANALSPIEPDLVYVNWSWATCGSVMYACRILNAPFMFSVRGTDVIPPAKNFNLRVRTAKAVLTPSRGYADLLRDRFNVPEDKIRIVPNAIAFERLRSVPPLSPKASEELHLLSISMLRPVKRLVDLLDACHILKEKGIRFKCRICGGGPDRDNMIAIIKKRGLDRDVELLGNVPQDQLFDQFQWCDIYTHTSESESFCYAVVEAQAAGRPVLAVDALGGMRQSVRAGETAVLVPARNPREFAEQLIRLYRQPDLRMRMGRAGKRFAWETFGFDSFRHRFIEALTSCKNPVAGIPGVPSSLK